MGTADRRRSLFSRAIACSPPIVYDVNHVNLEILPINGGRSLRFERSLVMAIPDYEVCMLPLLGLLADGQQWTGRKLTEEISSRFGLTEAERAERLPSGQQTYIANRVGWAKTYLKYAGLLESPSRGRAIITEKGRQVLKEKPAQIDRDYLKQFPSFAEFLEKAYGKKPKIVGTAAEADTKSDSHTPLETLNRAYEELQDATSAELLDRVKNASPEFFEKVVVDLLVAMGYGGKTGVGTVTGKPKDGGIDGIIKEDKLGLDIVCVQAKRWGDGVVGRPIVQQFVGSMDFTRARKGVIITTSTFSTDAIDFIERIEAKKVVLIDGDKLAELMMEHKVGVITSRTYELQEVSGDYFDEDL